MMSWIFCQGRFLASCNFCYTVVDVDGGGDGGGGVAAVVAVAVAVAVAVVDLRQQRQ